MRTGLLALSPETTTAVLAFPAQQVGHVFVKVYVGETNQQDIRTIKAHDSEISHLALNRDGSRLATTSVQAQLLMYFRVESNYHVGNGCADLGHYDQE